MHMMKHLRKYNESVSDIRTICRSYDITNYTINSDSSVDVAGNVWLSDMALSKLPLKFGRVSGYFLCSHNQLTSLEGCPIQVDGDFKCSHNQLTTLKDMPMWVGGDFICSHNQLTTLEGMTKFIGKNFYCMNNQLTSLKGCPKSISGIFYCDHNQLISLIGGPKSVSGYFSCVNNLIRSFEGFPEYIGGQFFCFDCPILAVWKLFFDWNKVELFNDYDIIRDDVIILDRLNSFLMDIDREPVTKIQGYKCI